MTSRRRHFLLVSLAVLILVYLLGPVIATVFEIGNRAGPKVYPRVMHEAIYMVAWEITPHAENKPRLPAVFRSEHRPWFYGMNSENDDPAWFKPEYERLQERIETERPAE
jgi:hypothetical protein